MTVSMMHILDFKGDASSVQQCQDEGLLSFHNGMKREYGQLDQDSLFDMTGDNFPHEDVGVTRIFQPSWRKFLPLLTSPMNINDVPNGLMLYKPVAWAFKQGKLCIEVDAQGRMSFRLFDHDLR